MRKFLPLVLLFGVMAPTSPAQEPAQLQQSMQPQQPAQPKDYTAYVVGQAHMDMAWLWRWEETIHNVMYLSFTKQLGLMDRYPDFTYVQDQAVALDMMQQYYPVLYEDILKKARSHNWIPASSTWTQMDENIPDGESLVRQFLYGQKSAKENFGHYVRLAWQLDVFGHPASMPQIARKAGIDFYLFTRPVDPKRPPVIWWQGLDGSRVLEYSPTFGAINHDYITVHGMKFADRIGVKNVLLLYGEGDHGYGPDAKDLDAIPVLNASPNDVRVKPTNVEDYFDLLLTEKKDFPVINGELNGFFEGVYTSQVDMKRHNRMAEQLLLAAEKVTSFGLLNHYLDVYSNADLTNAWKLALPNQTHDLLAGTGISPIYDEAAKQYQEVFERGNRVLKFGLENIGINLDTLGDGVPLVVYNTQSRDDTELVTAEISARSLPARMMAKHDQEVVPVQILKAPTREGDREQASIAFVAHKVPQMGLRLYRILPAESAPGPATSVSAGMKPRPYLENEFLRVEFDPATGNIARLYDKRNQHEALRGEGNFLVAIEDTQEEASAAATEGANAGTAWITGWTLGKQWEVNQAEKIEVVESGPARATIRIVHRFRDSDFTQDVSLIAGVPRVDVEMTTEWYERNTFLKVGFPVNATSSKVTADIPYGALDRDQTGKEMVMGKWVDISGSDYGVAILNNGRYGFDAKNNTIRLSVIRGPISPDPRADEGTHTFGYSIYPHRGGWRDAKVQYQALSFNQPLLALQEPAHKRVQRQWRGTRTSNGGLPSEYSFIQTDSDHVILYAIKQAEARDARVDLVLRFVESEGRPGEVAVHFPYAVDAVETNLLEDAVGPIGKGEVIRFQMKPWEIKTVRVQNREEELH